MDARDHQIAQRGVDHPLTLKPRLARKRRAFDLDREMRFPGAVVAGMTVMPCAVVVDDKASGIERGPDALFDEAGDRCHPTYIFQSTETGKWQLADGGDQGARRHTRFHGRIPGDRPCAEPGCCESGEFRAPLSPGSSDGPGHYRWLCLDHVREFNARYNFFAGMTPEEISAAQTPYAGWERETRAFATSGADRPPRWSDFQDPLDAIGARFRTAQADARQRADGKPLSGEDRRALKVLGLAADADRRALRTRYSELVRQYHPDRNGGDRSFEARLQAVIAAYTHLKRAPAFA